MFASRIMVACAAAVTIALAAAPVQAEKYGNYHILPTPAYIAKTGRAPIQDSGPMFYYGGSVFESVKVISVIWGPDVPSATVDNIPEFTTALVNSTYVDQLSPQYDTFLRGVNGHHGTKQHIARGSFLGQIQITPHNTSSSLTDADVQAELRYQIKHGVLPIQDLSTLYMVYFPSSVTINLDGLISCQDFGAYHFAKNDFKLANNNLFYAVEPACTYGLNTITFIAAHEFAEATTDNVPTPGSNPDFPQAWNDAQGFEIGDKCSTSGQLSDGTKSFTVTQVYLNSLGHCSTGNYHSP
jgi:hypothetical protein